MSEYEVIKRITNTMRQDLCEYMPGKNLEATEDLLRQLKDLEEFTLLKHDGDFREKASSFRHDLRRIFSTRKAPGQSYIDSASHNLASILDIADRHYNGRIPSS